MELKKTVIVTGAPQGIGAGIVEAFLSRGYNGCRNRAKRDEIEELSASDQLALIDGDIGQFETAQRVAELAIKKFGSIDALVANAGIFLVKPFTEYTPDDFRALVSTNLAEIQSDLFYDYRTNVESYPKWQAWMHEKQPRLLVIWGKHDLSFELSEPEAYRLDVPKAQVHVLDAGHFALDTAADEIAQLVRGFMK